MPTIGLFSLMSPAEPWKAALPKAKMPPSAATIVYPADGVRIGEGGRAGPAWAATADGRTATSAGSANTSASAAAVRAERAMRMRGVTRRGRGSELEAHSPRIGGCGPPVRKQNGSGGVDPGAQQLASAVLP